MGQPKVNDAYMKPQTFFISQDNYQTKENEILYNDIKAAFLQK